MSKIDRIIKIVRENIGNPSEEINLNTPLNDLNMDSLTFVEIVMCIEEEFEVEFDDSNISNPTVNTLYQEVLKQEAAFG